MPGQFAPLKMTETQRQIAVICDEIKNLLLAKNVKYGDSALDPVRIFSKASNIEQLFVRIDDKLSRISRGAGLSANDEDVINDLIGYLVLLKIAQGREKWDGTDIEPSPVTERKANVDELFRLHTTGDRFA